MLERLPVQIDPHRFAQSGRMLKGTIPLSQMERLSPLLLASDEVATVGLSFSRDTAGWTVIKGSIQASFRLNCQRCMQEGVFPTEITLLMAVIADSNEAERLPDYYEPLLMEESTVVLSDIIEDELLLMLPIVPMHDESSCDATSILNGMSSEMENALANEKKSEVDNPFAVLAELKR